MANIKIFEEKRIRSIWSETDQQWYFSIVDAIAALTDSIGPNAYWRKLKERLKKERNETVTNCRSLKMQAADGNIRFTDVASAQQMLRLIQSITSPKPSRSNFSRPAPARFTVKINDFFPATA